MPTPTPTPPPTRNQVSTGLSTNVLFPSLVLALLFGAIAGFGEVASALAALSRGEDVSLLLPAVSALFSGFCLVVIGYGLALAPKPETQKAAEQARESNA